MGKRFYLVLVVSLMASMAGADSIRLGDEIYREVYIRKGKDFYYVYHPEAGRMEQVSRHRANVSDVVISEDAAYRETLLARYRERAGLAKPDSDAAVTVKAPARKVAAGQTAVLDGALLKQRRQLEDLALFEAQLEHWRALPEGTREEVRGVLGDRLELRVAGRAADREAALAEVAQLESEKDLVARQWDAVAADRDAAVDAAQAGDRSGQYFDAYERSKGYYPTWHYYYDECERLRSVPIWWYTEDPSLYDAGRAELARTQGKIEAVERDYAAQSATLGKTLGSLESARAMQARAARSAVAKAGDEQRRIGGQQARAAALDDAVAQDYQPRLRVVPVASWRGTRPGRVEEFSVGEGLWRIDCRATNGATSGLSVTLYDADTGKPFTRIGAADFLGMRTRIFEGPGRYYAEVSLEPGVTGYEIAVGTVETGG